VDRYGIDCEGPFAALVTPFHPNGDFDEAGLRRHIEFLIARGVRGLVPNGCTGEFWAQTLDERNRVVAIVNDAAKGRVPVIAGVGASATRDVIELTRHARSIGCSGVMLMAPVKRSGVGASHARHDADRSVAIGSAHLLLQTRPGRFDPRLLDALVRVQHWSVASGRSVPPVTPRTATLI
jgi:dihydrodipicolinate synthase/N-acetylneuraminate lyase